MTEKLTTQQKQEERMRLLLDNMKETTGRTDADIAKLLSQNNFRPLPKLSARFDTFRQVRNDFASKVVRQKDDIIREQITRYLGHSDFRPNDLIGRLRIDVIHHSKVEIYYIDDVPLIEFYPTEFEQESNTLKANSSYRVLLMDEQCKK